jgi:hypothetical protein
LVLIRLRCAITHPADYCVQKTLLKN